MGFSYTKGSHKLVLMVIVMALALQAPLATLLDLTVGARDTSASAEYSGESGSPEEWRSGARSSKTRESNMDSAMDSAATFADGEWVWGDRGTADNNYIAKVEVRKDFVCDPLPDDLLQDLVTPIDKANPVFLNYYFELPATGFNSADQQLPAFELPIPEQFLAAAPPSSQTVMHGGMDVASWEIKDGSSGGQSLWVTYIPNRSSSVWGRIKFSANFVEDSIGNVEDLKVPFVLGTEDQEITFTFKRVAEAASIAATKKLNGATPDGKTTATEYEWVIELKPTTSPTQGLTIPGVVISDEIQSPQVYDPTTPFTLVDANGTDMLGTLLVNGPTGNTLGKLTYTADLVGGETYTATYNTKLTDDVAKIIESVKGGDTIPINNTVKVSYPPIITPATGGAIDPGARTEKAATKNYKKDFFLLGKDGAILNPGDFGRDKPSSVVTWSFTFNEAGIDLSSSPVEITDLLAFVGSIKSPDGVVTKFPYLGAPTGIKIAPGKITVNAANYSAMNSIDDANIGSAYYEITQEPSEGVNCNKLTIKGLETLSPFSPYTIAFQTVVDNRYFYQNNSKISNKAVLHVGSSDFTPVEADVGTGTGGSEDVDNSMIAKKGTGYDAATRIIDWKITINAAKSTITNAEFMDTFPELPDESAQELISDSIKVFKNGSADAMDSDFLNYNANYDSATRTLSKSFTDTEINATTYVITYKTKVLSPKIWGDNSASHKVNNTAELQYNYSSGGVTYFHRESGTADQPTPSEVIRKKWGGYNYDTQEATWAITFNQKGMPIDDCIITDTIPAGQSYVGFELTSPPPGITAGDVKVTTAPESSGGSSEQTVKFSFDKLGVAKQVNGQGVLKVKTKVHTVLNQGNAVNNDKKTVTLKNKATIEGAVEGTHFDGPQVNATDAKDLAADVVDKKGNADVDTCTIKWTLDLNRLGVTDGGKGEIAYIVDTFPNDLTLVGRSVKLYKAEVNPVSGVATKTQPEISPHGITLTHVSDEADPSKDTPIDPTGAMEAAGKVRFTFAKPLTEPYILEFVTDVEPHGNKYYTNSVSLSGDAGALIRNSNPAGGPFPTFGSEGHGKNGSLIVNKTDASNADKKLAGAEFKLRNVAYGYDIEGGVTNADGRIVNPDGSPYYDNLYLGIPYELIETKAPDHYKLTDPENGDIVKTFTLGKKGDLPNKPDNAELTIENTQSADPGDLGRLTVVKVDSENNAHKLPGAKFTLQKNFGDRGFITPTTASTGSNGQLVFDKLKFGKYTLTETAPPDGYTLNSAPQEITVSGDANEFAQTIEVANAPDPTATTASVVKTDAQTGEPLPGVTFELSGKTAGGLPQSKTTDANGNLTFGGLMYSDYTLTETAAPPGYVLDSTPRSFTLSSANRTHTEEFKNSPTPATVVVAKVDAIDALPLEYVQFTLTDVTERPDREPMRTYITNADGKITINDLRWGDYELVETKPLPEYEQDTTVHAIHVGHGSAAAPIEIAIENTPKPGDATVRKLDAANQSPLAGAVFECRDAATGMPIAGSPQTTGSDGIASFGGLRYGSYTIKEITAPPAFELNPIAIPFKISSDPGGKLHKHFSIDVSNAQLPGSITLTKLAAGQPDTRLEGAVFQLRSAAGTPIGAPQTTGADGIAKFSGLPHGDYVVSEEKAPVGYQLPKTTWAFKIPGESGKLDFTADIENSLAPSSGGGGGGGSTPSVPKLPHNDPPKDPGSSAPGGEAPPVTPPTEPPVVTPPDTPANGTVDVPLGGSVAVTTPPTHGTVTVNGGTGEWTYTPSPGYKGDDFFTFTVSDKDGKLAPKTVLVTIEDLEVPLAKGNLPVTGDSSPAAACVAAAAAMTAMLLLRRRKTHK